MSAVLKPESSFEPMAVGDLDEVSDIERETYDFPWTWGNFCDSISAGYSCWMYRLNGMPVGYCIVTIAAEEAHLLNISIAAEFQRAGHGRRLLNHVLEVARSGGARMLFLEVRPTNAGARELYKKSGFRQIGVRRDYYPNHNGREDAIVLSIEL